MTQTRSGNAHHSALSPRRVLPFCPLARLGGPFVMDVRIDRDARAPLLDRMSGC
jgi:hypothetical protein